MEYQMAECPCCGQPYPGDRIVVVGRLLIYNEDTALVSLTEALVMSELVRRGSANRERLLSVMKTNPKVQCDRGLKKVVSLLRVLLADRKWPFVLSYGHSGAYEFRPVLRRQKEGE